MRAPDRFEFTTQASHQREGMLIASKALMKGQNALVSAILTISIAVLCGLGGMALVTFVASMFDFSPAWWVLLGWFAGGGLYLASFQILYSQMAHVISQRALHHAPQAITFDEMGLTYEATPARWTTPWSMIDAIHETKQTITISVSGIAFTLPKNAVGDEGAVTRLITDLKAQIEDA
ncbi:YcxB family protein [Octadecabacter sp. G9-8]|uniref:YcxB family protein n=1 Tax=Octadecabacter dasysiphoniae TaxID=2909341 RepID=A0ABS9CW90_9RHOB|nr:YcxB family protein [Octadecabacter dasysiphoniae]MCF2871211.1 YcxB family protein [Octadecabacter dasysiphoniae]